MRRHPGLPPGHASVARPDILPGRTGIEIDWKKLYRLYKEERLSVRKRADKPDKIVSMRWPGPPRRGKRNPHREDHEADHGDGVCRPRRVSRLCDSSGETALLACGTRDDRLIAVCSDAEGMLRLIIRQESHPDISLPKDRTDGTVSTGWNRFASGGTYARFKGGELDYVAYIGLGSGWEQAGLSEVDPSGVSEDGEAPHVAEHVCLPASQQYDTGFPVSGEVAGLAVDDEPTFHIRPVQE